MTTNTHDRTRKTCLISNLSMSKWRSTETETREKQTMKSLTCQRLEIVEEIPPGGTGKYGTTSLEEKDKSKEGLPRFTFFLVKATDGSM